MSPSSSRMLWCSFQQLHTGSPRGTFLMVLRHALFGLKPSPRAETYQSWGNEEGGKLKFKFENGASICLISQSINSINLSKISLSLFYLFKYLSINCSIDLSICLFICLSLCLPACLPAWLSVCLSVYLSVYLSIGRFVYLMSVYLSIYICLLFTSALYPFVYPCFNSIYISLSFTYLRISFLYYIMYMSFHLYAYVTYLYLIFDQHHSWFFQEEPAKEPELVRVASGAETPFEFLSGKSFPYHPWDWYIHLLLVDFVREM